jgi:hypothetical protein
MRKISRFNGAIVVLLVLWAVPALAQDAPAVELFGGYSALVDDAALHGWQASVALNPSRTFGLVADFAGQYDSPLRFHQFLFGPRVNGRFGRINPFGHALVGIERASASGFPSDSDLALGIGGGVDVRLGDSFSIRAIQFDWIPIKETRWSTSTVRFGVGLVLAFGR